MKLSVLDLLTSLEDTVELAPFVEQLGYERYWISEHQPQPTPILVVSIVAGLTQHIRVGTAGVLFHYYSPLRTAHDFLFLARAFANRIDAGVCGGHDPLIPPEDLEGRDMAAIQRAYPERVGRLVAHLRNTPGDPRFEARLAWQDAPDDPPQIWSLGGGARSAALAAKHGLHFGYSLLYRQSVDEPANIESYRRDFVPDRTQPEPRAVLAVCGVCAPTDDEANALAAVMPSEWFMPRVVGTPDACADQLRALAERYRVDEIVFADRIVGLDARKRCYELLAKAIG